VSDRISRFGQSISSRLNNGHSRDYWWLPGPVRGHLPVPLGALLACSRLAPWGLVGSDILNCNPRMPSRPPSALGAAPRMLPNNQRGQGAVGTSRLQAPGSRLQATRKRRTTGSKLEASSPLGLEAVLRPDARYPTTTFGTQTYHCIATTNLRSLSPLISPLCLNSANLRPHATRRSSHGFERRFLLRGLPSVGVPSVETQSQAKPPLMLNPETLPRWVPAGGEPGMPQ